MKGHTEMFEGDGYACYLAYDGLWAQRKSIKWCHSNMQTAWNHASIKLCKNNFVITVSKSKWSIQVGSKRLYLSRSTFSRVGIKMNAPNTYLHQLYSFINMLDISLKNQSGSAGTVSQIVPSLTFCGTFSVLLC